MSRPLKILHVATHAGVWRGGAVQACRMANGLAAGGHEVALIRNREGGKKKRAEGARTWRERLDQRVKLYSLPLEHKIGVWALRAFLRWHRPDIVHAHRDTALMAAVEAARHNRSFTLIAQRGTTTVPPPEALEAFRSPRLGAVNCVAQAVKDVMVGDAGLPEELVRVIYGSVDTEKYSPAPRNDELRTEIGFGPDDFVVGSMSAWRKDKGLDMLIEGAAKAAQRQSNLRFLFLGKNTKKWLLPLSEEHGVTDRCYFADHQDDVLKWLRAMDCTVVCARGREGLSGVLRESLAAGIPVISTASDGNPEIVRDRETGLLVPVDDVEAMADALVHAVANREEMHSMAERGRAWVLENCTVEKQAAALEELYLSQLT